MSRFREAKEALDNILELLEDTDFGYWMNNEGCFYGDDNYEEGEANNLEEFFAEGNYPSNIRWNSGATRLVFWDEDFCDYVFKVPKEFGDETYNETEEQMYNEAVFADVEDAFAWCSCIYSEGHKFERSIYAMEFVYCDEEEVSGDAYSFGYENYCEWEGLDPKTDEAKDRYSDYYWSRCDENSELLEYAISCWDKGELIERFINKFSISDLHAGNFGYRNGQLVITDYASF